MTDWPRIVIAGGSIGGLTAAILLRDLGCEVDVYERSSEALQSRGAGIVVLPMTERYFVEHGRAGGRVSLALTYWTYVDAEGHLLSADPDCFRFSSWNTVYRGPAGLPGSRLLSPQRGSGRLRPHGTRCDRPHGRRSRD
ncbi:MAG: hypothetical protein ACXWH0_08605 [Acidimicrobiia bacterium]